LTSSLSNKPNCAGCKHYDPTGQSAGTGLCRLLPPIWNGTLFAWPLCDDSDWCGKHAAR